MYHATKFAVEGLSESLAQEVAWFGIKVTIIEPGSFRTEWSGRSAVVAAELSEYANTPAGYVRNLLKTSHGQEPGDPARAARVIVSVAQQTEPPLKLLAGSIGSRVPGPRPRHRAELLAGVAMAALDSALTEWCRSRTTLPSLIGQTFDEALPAAAG